MSEEEMVVSDRSFAGFPVEVCPFPVELPGLIPNQPYRLFHKMKRGEPIKMSLLDGADRVIFTILVKRQEEEHIMDWKDRAYGTAIKFILAAFGEPTGFLRNLIVHLDGGELSRQLKIAFTHYMGGDVEQRHAVADKIRRAHLKRLNRVSFYTPSYRL